MLDKLKVLLYLNEYKKDNPEAEKVISEILIKIDDMQELDVQKELVKKNVHNFLELKQFVDSLIQRKIRMDKFVNLNRLISYGYTNDVIHLHIPKMPDEINDSKFLNQSGVAISLLAFVDGLEKLRMIMDKPEIKDKKEIFCVSHLLRRSTAKFFENMGFDSESITLLHQYNEQALRNDTNMNLNTEEIKEFMSENSKTDQRLNKNGTSFEQLEKDYSRICDIAFKNTGNEELRYQMSDNTNKVIIERPVKNGKFVSDEEYAKTVIKFQKFVERFSNRKNKDGKYITNRVIGCIEIPIRKFMLEQFEENIVNIKEKLKCEIEGNGKDIQAIKSKYGIGPVQYNIEDIGKKCEGIDVEVVNVANGQMQKDLHNLREERE